MILDELSPLLGYRVKAAPEVAGEVIAIRVVDVSPKELLDRIAQVSTTKWVQHGEILFLERDVERTFREEAKEHEEQVALVKKAFEKLRQSRPNVAFDDQVAADLAKKLARRIKEFQPDQLSKDSYELNQSVDDQGPAGRAITNLVLAMDPGEFVDLPTEVKTVWSSKPNHLQRALPSEALQIAQRFRDEQNTWAEAASKYEIHEPTINGMTYGLNNLSAHTSPVSGSPTKLFLTARRFSSMSGINLSMMIVDSKGHEVGTGNLNLVVEGLPFNPAAPTPDEPSDPKFSPAPIAASLLKIMTSPGRSHKIPDDIRTLGMRPDKYEPLGYFLGESITNAAAAKNLNVVADMADESLSLAFAITTGKDVGANGFFKRLLFGFDENTDGDWLTLSPKRPSRARAERIDRDQMTRYVSLITSDAKSTFLGRARIAASMPRIQTNGMVQVVQLAAIGDLASVIFNDFDTLRFIGSLTDYELGEMQTANGLSIRAIQGRATTALNTLLFGNSAWLDVQPPRTSNGPSFDWELANILRQQPTEALGYGLLETGRLTFESKSDSAVQSPAHQGPNGINWGSQTYDLEGLANQLAMMQHPEVFPWMANQGSQVDKDHLRMVNRTTYAVLIDFGPMVKLRKTIEESTPVPNSSEGYNNLPAEFRDKLEKLVAQQSKQYSQMRGQMPAVSTPSRIPPSP